MAPRQLHGFLYALLRGKGRLQQLPTRIEAAASSSQPNLRADGLLQTFCFRIAAACALSAPSATLLAILRSEHQSLPVPSLSASLKKWHCIDLPGTALIAPRRARSINCTSQIAPIDCTANSTSPPFWDTPLRRLPSPAQESARRRLDSAKLKLRGHPSTL